MVLRKTAAAPAAVADPLQRQGFPLSLLPSFFPFPSSSFSETRTVDSWNAPLVLNTSAAAARVSTEGLAKVKEMRDGEIQQRFSFFLFLLLCSGLRLPASAASQSTSHSYLAKTNSVSCCSLPATVLLHLALTVSQRLSVPHPLLRLATVQHCRPVQVLGVCQGEPAQLP